MRTPAPSLPDQSAAAQPTRPDLADASVLGTVRGVPSWAALLVAVVPTAVGAVIDTVGSAHLGWGVRIGFLVGIALAALAVRRGSIFTAMVQAPLVLVVVTVLVRRVLAKERFTFTLIEVVNAFPTMAIGTALGLLLGLIRILAQPLRSRSATVRAHA